MEEFPHQKDWLGVTEQQHDIIKTINVLNNLKIKPTPSNIDKKLKELFGYALNKPNLFRQLKRLVGMNIISKSGKANYTLNFEGLKENLKKREKDMISDLGQFKKFSSDIEQIYKHIGEKEDISARYLNSAKEFFEEVNKILINSDKIYIVSPFANISFSNIISASSHTKEYIGILIEKGFVKKELEINYLTQFNLFVPFYYAYAKLKDKKAAIKEVEITIHNLKNILKNQKMVNMHFLEYPYGFDFLMPVVDNDPHNVFIYTRDEHNIITGGIHIRSREIAKRAEQHFLRECNVGIDLKTKEGQKLIGNLFSKLRKAKF